MVRQRPKELYEADDSIIVIDEEDNFDSTVEKILLMTNDERNDTRYMAEMVLDALEEAEHQMGCTLNH